MTNRIPILAARRGGGVAVVGVFVEGGDAFSRDVQHYKDGWCGLARPYFRVRATATSTKRIITTALRNGERNGETRNESFSFAIPFARGAESHLGVLYGAQL